MHHVAGRRAPRAHVGQLFQLTSLERRLLLCAEGHDGLLHGDPGVLGTFPAPAGDHLEVTPGVARGKKGGGGSSPSAGPTLTNVVPAYNSLPGATASLFLDFDGHFEPQWGSYSNVATPQFNLDGAAGFNQQELDLINRVYRQVAEDYAPFRINVTTVQPASFANGAAMRVSIGGNGSWLGQVAGGVAYVDSFTNSIANTVYVFTDNLSAATASGPKYVAEASSHESGHSFGLQHQSSYTGSIKTNEYSGGNGDGRAPIMGSSYYATRGLWWKGASSISSTNIQDDMAVLAKSANGFGYRVDDHGNSAGSATALVLSGTNVSGAGVIAQTGDLDYFSFSTGAGNVNITLAVPDAVNNLDSKLELRSANGLSLITASAPSNSFGATVSANLAAGSYQLVAASHGNYGDVGQYTIHGTVAAQASNGLNAPSNLLGSANGTTGLVSLSWVDNATAEQNYVVERRTDGTSFATIATLGANSVGHVDNTATPGTTHYYQVRATNGADSSPASNVATATTVPLAPATLSATTGGSGAITLNWANVVGEQGYKVLRSTSSGGGFTQVGTTGAGVLTFNDTGLAASTTYYYHVIAYNAGGDGATSPQAFATTAAAPALPAAPSGLVATAITKTRVDLVWIDHASNEDGFRVERRLSTSNTWTQIGQIGVNVKAFSDTTAQARKTYIYRVRAFNAAGNSGYSNTAQATTPKRSPIVLASMGTRLSPRSTISSQAVGTGWVVRLSSNLFNDASTTSIFSDMAIGSGDLA